MINLDPWQKNFIAEKGNKILVAGRQTGKSEAQAYDNAEFAVNNSGVNCLIISKTQRQSEELLLKTLAYLQEKYPDRIGKGKYKPLKYSVWVTHKGKKPSKIMCQPVGLAGEGIRGYTIHKLSADEAQLIDDEVFTAVTPMLLTTNGSISLSGTPRGKIGFFYSAFTNKLGHYKVFHVSTQDVIENRPIHPISWPEWRREAALRHLATERQRMTQKAFASEYEGVFCEDLTALYPDDLVNRCCTGKINSPSRSSKYYLGVDVGRIHDPSTFEIIDAQDNNSIKHTQSIVIKQLTIPQTARQCEELNKIYKFRKMGIDGGGMGSGVVDLLMENRSIRDNVKDLNNSSRIIEVKANKEKRSRLLKEQMYLNLLSLMHENKIVLLDDDEVKASLKSVQVEYKEGTDELIIFGNDTHITEGIIRACWLATKDKSLNLWVTSSNDVGSIF